MKNKNIIVVQNLLRSLPIAVLQDAEVVANLIRAFGIVCWGPPVFGDDEIFKNRHEDMAGIYQTPIQMAEALVYLSQFKIESYCEIGVFQGGNFLFMSEYLRRFNSDIICTGIDPTDYLNFEIEAIIEKESWLRFYSFTSEALKKREWDLVFIDGEHEGGWVVKDWNNVGKYAKICMFHDIQEITCPEPVALWQKLKQLKGKIVKEYRKHSAAVPLHGIGIIHREGLL